jgi:hypothetical protein
MRKRTFLILLAGAILASTLAITLRGEGSGFLTRLISSIPGH